MPYPPEREGSEGDNRSHYHATQFPGSEAKQEGDDHSQRNGPEHETRCEGHTDLTHHEKADSDKQSGKLGVQLHYSPRAGMSFGVVVLHRLIVSPVTPKATVPSHNWRNIFIALIDPQTSLYLGTLRNSFTANTSLV